MIYLAGIDGSGKTTIKEFLEEHGYSCSDRYSPIDKLTFTINYDEFPESIDENVIILTANHDVLVDRINSRDEKDLYETPRSLFYFDRRFREIAVYYGIPIIDTTFLTPKETAQKVLNAMKEFPFKNLRPEDILQDDSFHLLVEGESKKVFTKDDDKYCYIILKNTIYSHSMQSTGVIEDLGAIRGEGSRYFLEMMNRNCIKHSYICINNFGVICSEFIENINPLEVVVKEYCEGTDKHSYYKYRDNFTHSDGKYKHGPYVRFDWRNPNHLTEHGIDVREAIPNYYKEEEKIGKLPFFEKYLKKPMGDKTISEHILKDIIDIDVAKEEALKMFYTIKYHFEKAGLIIKDICFMMSGDKFWSEINQDCMRIQLIDSKTGTLDKDIWRSGGSSRKEKIIGKWKLFNSIMKKHFKSLPYHETSMLFYWDFDYQLVMKKSFETIDKITHKSIYYKLLRPGKRKFIVKYDKIPNQTIFPDIIVNYDKEQSSLYKKFYPHVICKNYDEAKDSIASSARRVLLETDIPEIPNKRKILFKSNSTDVKLFNENIMLLPLNCKNEIIQLCSSIPDVEKAWRLGAIPIVNEDIAYNIWKLTFKIPNPVVIIQDINGKIKETKNMIGHLPQNVQKISIDKEGKSVIFTVEKHDTKNFSNQNILKASLEILQKHSPSDQTALLKIIQDVWKIEENPAEFVKNLIVYLNSKEIKLRDIQNELNADRWNIFKKQNLPKRKIPLIAITSSKYQQKTIDFLRNILGIELLPKESKKSLQVGYNIVDIELYKKYFNTSIKFISCRPKDMPWLMAFNRIDGSITYNTVIENYPKVYNKKHTIEDNNLSLCLIKKKGKDLPQNPKIAAEHYNLIKPYVKGNIDIVFGSSESYLVNSDYDVCDAIVETGSTINENNLEIYNKLPITVKIGLFTCM